MTARILESFDAEPAPSADEIAYLRGVEDGKAAALAEMANAQDRLTAELVQNLNDLEFKFAEARADITQAISPVFQAMSDKLFPAIVDRLYIFRIADILRDAAMAQVPEQLSLAVHPEQVDVVSAAARELSPQVVVVPDPDLTLNAVLLRYADESRLFDPEHLLGQIATLLDTIINPTERKRDDGTF